MMHYVVAAALGAALFCASARAEEPWLARAFVPSSNSVHGEVRLLQRGPEACMQTLLYSKYLRRGLHEMAKQERKAWPEGWPCCEVSSNYLADLATVREAVLANNAGEDTNALRRMLIEFTLSPTGASYAIGELDLTGPPEALQAVSPRPLVIRQAHPHYISRAMFIMGQQGFGLSDEELERLLEKAGWRPVEAPELPPMQRFVPR